MKSHTPHELGLIADYKFIHMKREAEAIQIRRHDAASRSIRHDPRYDFAGGANTAIGSEKDRLRQRSLSMLENNPTAIQAQRVETNGLIGTGIQPSVRKVPPELEKLIMEDWHDWADFHDCDHNERENFVSLCHQMADAVFATGDCIIRRRRLPDGEIQLQLHEGDYIDASMHGTVANDDGGYTMFGIDYSKEGKVLRYHLFDSLDDSAPLTNLQSRPIPADDIIHVFFANRAGQRSGLPWLKTVYMSMMNLDRFEDADLQRAIVAAMHAAFVEGSPEGQSGFETTDTANLLERMEPGMVKYLRIGERMTFSTPPSYNGVEPYIKTKLRKIAAGIGITYEALSGDYSDVNFSSAKMGANEMERQFVQTRERVIKYPLNRIWQWRMESMVLRGVLAMPMAQARKIRADWTAPKRAMIDSVKETEGLRLQIAAGLISPQEAVRQLGGDFSDITTELELALTTFKGLDFTPSWAIASAEIHELAIESEAKMVTAEAAKKNATKAVAAAAKSAVAPAAKPQPKG